MRTIIIFMMKPLPAELAPATDGFENRAAHAGIAARVNAIQSQQLFGGRRRELLIEHAGLCYRLRITQNNKLILTK